MNTCKKFLVLGIALININSYNIANGNDNQIIDTVHKNIVIGGSLDYSKSSVEVDSLITVRNDEYDSTTDGSELANFSFGTKPENREENYEAHTMSLVNGAILEQTGTGHIHIYDNVTAKDGSTILASAYSDSHINGPTMVNEKPVTKIIDDGSSAGFDIHGDSEGNGGYLKFEKGSRIGLSFKEGEDQTQSPALYLCNANSRVNISDILPKKDPENNPKKTEDTNVHIVGTSNENDPRNGNIDIFNDSGDPSSNDYVNKLEEQLNNMGNNDVIADKGKINIPSWTIESFNPGGEGDEQVPPERQQLIVTSLEEPGANETANNTDIISGEKIQLVDENGNKTEFISGNLLEILKNNYLMNEGDEYTYIVNKEGEKVGIKIKPQISDLNDLDEISKVFVPSSNKTVSSVDEGETDKRASILEFIRSIAPKGQETDEDKKLKLNVYKKANEEGKKYHVYNVYLNNNNYTWDLDKFTPAGDNIIPLKIAAPEGDRPYMDLTSLTDYKDAEGNPNTLLQIYANIKGNSPKRWKLPTVNDEEGTPAGNQIQEIDFLGNNTKFTKFISLLEGNFDSYVNKIVFGKNSYIKTERTEENKSKPIAWEFIDSNSNVNQETNLYASNITHHLDLMNLKHENKTEDMTVTIDNEDNASQFNSYIYADEVSKDKTALTPNKDTSLVVSKKATLRLLSKAKSNDPNNRFVPRNVLISHVDSSAKVIKEFNNKLDSIAQYYPTSPYVKATVPVEQQIQNYNANENPSVECHISIPRDEFVGIISFPEGDSGNMVHLDLTIATDPNAVVNNKKLQFYNMMEYVYDSLYDKENPNDFRSRGNNNPSNEEKNSYNTQFLGQNNPHLFIPLYRYQDDNINYYFLTNFEVFPGYSKEKLATNFINATTKDHIKLQNIIPNIYIGSVQQHFAENEKTTFGSNKPMDSQSKYVVYKTQD